MNRKLKKILAPIIFIVAIVILWEVLCTVLHVSEHVLPKPSVINKALVKNFSKSIYPDMLISLRVMLTGYIIAVPLGFVIAALLAQSKFAVRMFLPILIVLMVTPMAALVSILKGVMGVNIQLKVLIVVLQCTPVVAVNTLTGFTNVPQNKLDLMKGYGCKKAETFFRVTVPNAMPEVFVGLELGCILCTIAAMSADLSVGQGGLGYRISVSSALSNTDTAFATILVVAIIGVVFYLIVASIGNKVINWK